MIMKSSYKLLVIDYIHRSCVSLYGLTTGEITNDQFEEDMLSREKVHENHYDVTAEILNQHEMHLLHEYVMHIGEQIIAHGKSAIPTKQDIDLFLSSTIFRKIPNQEK